MGRSVTPILTVYRLRPDYKATLHPPSTAMLDCYPINVMINISPNYSFAALETLLLVHSLLFPAPLLSQIEK